MTSEHDNQQRGEASNAAVLDQHVLQSLRELGGEDEPGLIFELIEIFLMDAPQRMHEIEHGLSNNDLKLLERAAHTLKSSAANIGANTLSDVCRRIEELARARTTAGVAPLMRETTRVFGDVERALKALRP